MKTKNFNKILELNDTISKINKLTDCNFVYHGLKELNSDGYPYFVQWNFMYPLISINKNIKSTFVQLSKEIGFAVETILGNVKDMKDYQKQIDDAFKLKKKKQDKFIKKCVEVLENK